MKEQTNKPILRYLPQFLVAFLIALAVVALVYQFLFKNRFADQNSFTTNFDLNDEAQLVQTTESVLVASGEYQIASEYNPEIYQQAFQAAWQELLDKNMIEDSNNDQLIEVRYYDPQAGQVVSTEINYSLPVMIVLEKFDSNLGHQLPINVRLNQADQQLYIIVAQPDEVRDARLETAIGMAFDQIATRGEAIEGPRPILSKPQQVLAQNQAKLLDY